VLDSLGHVDDHRADIERTILQNIDELIARKNGKELEQWLGFATARDRKKKDADGKAPPSPAATATHAALASKIVLGDRGAKLLGLSPKNGFRERSVVALWRGVDALQRGLPLDAMRGFATAMQRSDESKNRDEIHNLAKRWFAYVLAQHRVDDESLSILKEFVAPIDRNELLEVLLWRAAFYVDAASFDRVAELVRKGGSLDLRVAHLELLSRGDAGAMWTQVRADYKSSAQPIYKLAHQLTDELATESLDVRLKNRVTLELGRALLAEVAAGANRGLANRIAELLRRMQTMLDTVDEYDRSAIGRARSAAPGSEAFAGSVRLAPGDPMPWPFPIPRVQPPSPFSALVIDPVEWRDESGELVFGWHIHEK
jgi:hypothetical protein